ncbi:2-hydroxyacid dehydrogenase [Niveispirillum irakense]|uniref:2-hydroxyacid dehydrogenase n=1 Tax=Niveispirillum irakense TaxID=34011 RepID=UPI00041BCCA5|nr:2-hydroxyacid dehydrogenase [Niveispirillum irakense]
MRVAVFSTKPYDRRFFQAANLQHGHEVEYFETRLGKKSALLAKGFSAVCVFVNDRLDGPTLEVLATGGVQTIALRCAGYNNVDLEVARRLGMQVVNVPAYSPEAVAEFTVGLILSLDRHIHRAWMRVRENNFSLVGLTGRNLIGRTVGVVGTGRIGGHVARILKLGFGCRVLASDAFPDPALMALGIDYLDFPDLLAQSDILTLHCPLTPDNRHLVDEDAIAAAKPGLMLINTSRGGLIDSAALIKGLKSRKLGGVALDVYEDERDLFFEDLSNEIVQDDVFQRLLTFPNVLVTGHQAFLTEEALTAIAETTLKNLTAIEAGEAPPHVVA